MEKSIEVDSELIARCGLYCGACRKYLFCKCPGCRLNKKASWCKIRSCSASMGYYCCEDCTVDVKQCKTFSTLIGKIFALFGSDRSACIARIREIGKEEYAREMAREHRKSHKKR